MPALRMCRIPKSGGYLRIEIRSAAAPTGLEPVVTASKQSPQGILAASKRHQPRTHTPSPRRLRRMHRLMLTKLAGMAFSTIVLYPGSENHHTPAEERGGQANNNKRDNKGYLAHARS